MSSEAPSDSLGEERAARETTITPSSGTSISAGASLETTAPIEN